MKEQLRNEIESHKDVHKQEIADISNKFNKFKTTKRNNNKPKPSEDLTVSAEKSLKEYKEYFTTTLNELKTKV